MMDLHHVEPRGPKSIAQIAAQGGALAKLQRELAKCVAICVLCHRMEHCERDDCTHDDFAKSLIQRVDGSTVANEK